MSENSFQTRGIRTLRWGVWCVIAGLSLTVVMMCVFAMRAAEPTVGDGTRAAVVLLPTIPTLGYLWALLAVQRALGDIARGRIFETAMTSMLRHIGIGVLAGALFNVFAVTNLARWMEGGKGGYLMFDVSGIVLGVVGATLIVLAQVMAQARTMRIELDEII